MIGKKISHYKILEELGAGGMGVVYKAEDSKLKRVVALKFVVPRMLKKKEDKERFLREAQTAASLNHPHICTIYQIDEVEDSTFIVMEYIEGNTLKEIIKKDRLEPQKALDFAIQVAEGLEEAQEKNIVHRDIKSSNIMVTAKSQAKIMDFGLAKIVSESQLTETASIMGTVAYMSPEHASGDAIDHRSDIWSLGVVLYEMLTGELPFQGDHEQLVLYSILNKFHKPITELRPSIPAALERIVDKCLEKDPTERYQHPAELLADLRWLKRETDSGVIPRTKPTWKIRRAKRIRKLAIPGILAFAALALISGIVFFDWFQPSDQWKTSVAVLPIENLSQQEENEALCVYTTRAIIDKISLLSHELKVVPFESVLLQKQEEKTNLAVGRKLNAEYVLHSTLQTDGKIIRIISRLINVRDNRLVKPFEYRESEQEKISILDIQDNISKAIVSELGIHFAESGLLAAKEGEPQNEDAYKWYVQGMHVIDTQDTYPSVIEWFDLATKRFKNAIDLDPDYALAYWGLGAAHEAYYIETEDEEILDLTIHYFEKAYELNRNLAETNLGSGWAYFYLEDFNRAHMRFKRALDLNPTSPLINCDAGSFLASIGLYYRAIDFFSLSMQKDPGYLRAYVLNSMCHWYVGELQEGVRILETAMRYRQDDFFMHLELANHLVLLGDYHKAEEELSIAESLKPGSSMAGRALLYAYRGEVDEAMAYLHDLQSTHHYIATCIYSVLGMHSEAIANIQRGIEIGLKAEGRCLYGYPILQNHPCYQALHYDPGFLEILEKEKRKYELRLKMYGDF
jgi:serine/threonine protein kinase/Tfp pilus assembly protein PilF